MRSGRSLLIARGVGVRGAEQTGARRDAAHGPGNCGRGLLNASIGRNRIGLYDFKETGRQPGGFALPPIKSRARGISC
jgi:hypothetical protein